MIVVDASAAVALCLSAEGFGLVDEELTAPWLLRSESLSALHGLAWRCEISEELAELALARLLAAPIALVGRRQIVTEARRLARRLGWAKTYDAEYVALARLKRCPLLTIDARLARRVADLVELRAPA